MTTRNTVRFVLIAACSILLPAHAHHSYGMFDLCTPTALEGEIEAVEWANPHIVIYLRTQEVDRYRIEWYSLGQLQREGIGANDRRSCNRHGPRDARSEPQSSVVALGDSQTERRLELDASAAGAGELHDELTRARSCTLARD